MARRPPTDTSPCQREVRSYSLGMMIELADLAEGIHEEALADGLRGLAWLDKEPRSFSGNPDAPGGDRPSS